MTTARAAELLYKKVASVEKVKTIWQVDKEVKLRRFYFPSRVLINSKPVQINSIGDLEPSHHYVLQGTIGQGKSTFLRFLCISELEKGDRFPLFVELRRLEKGQRLIGLLTDALEVLGFKDPNSKLFDFLANSGKLVLLLDGFDELAEEKISSVITDIERMAEKYANLQIIVTSRPNSGIEQSPKLRVLQLAPLRPTDHEPFLSKIVTAKEKRAELVRAIAESTAEIKELLTTPLLLTLLVLVYKAEHVVPRELGDFYESLFATLLSRHDKTKPGYVRHRFTELGDKALQVLFEAFCFISRNKSLNALTEDQLYESVQAAAKHTGLKCTSEAFRLEMTKVACLMQEEAHKFYFVHKSVQEYYAAMFVKRSPEEFAVRFYQSMMTDKNWRKWRQELTFLSQIDLYRYNKYFEVPGIERLFSELGVWNGANFVALPEKFDLVKFLSRYVFDFARREKLEIEAIGTANPEGNLHSQVLSLTLLPVLFRSMEDLPLSIIEEAASVPKDTALVNGPAAKLLANHKFAQLIRTHLEQELRMLNSRRLESIKLLQREERKAVELIQLI